MSDTDSDTAARKPNFVRELAEKMPLPDPEETPFADAFADWLKAVSSWQDEVERRLTLLEGKIDALCQIVSH